MKNTEMLYPAATHGGSQPVISSTIYILNVIMRVSANMYKQKYNCRNRLLLNNIFIAKAQYHIKHCNKDYSLSYIIVMK
jgi:hypothetical protein